MKKHQHNILIYFDYIGIQLSLNGGGTHKNWIVPMDPTKIHATMLSLTFL